MLCELCLSPVVLFAKFSKSPREIQFDFYKLRLARREPEKVTGGAHTPPCSFQPPSFLRFHRSFLPGHTLVAPQPLSSNIQHTRGRRASLLLKDLENNDRIRLHAVKNPPCDPAVVDPQFMTVRSNLRHRSRERHVNQFTVLKAPK